MANAFEQILYEVDDPVATITLNRPDQLNAWTARMGHEVAAAVGLAEADPTVVGIVITGAGRGFCAGADLAMLADVTDAAGRRRVPGGRRRPDHRRGRRHARRPRCRAPICAARTPT